MAYIQDPLQSPIPRTNATNNTLQGQYPVPGGPNPAPQTSVREALSKELANAGQIAKQTRSNIGMGSEGTEGPATTVPLRGIKIGNRIVAQAELEQFSAVQKNAVDDFIRQAGFTNQHDINYAKFHITNRFNQKKLELIKMANKFNKKLMQEKVDREKRGLFAKNFGAAAGAILGATIGGISGGPGGAIAGASLGGAAGGAVGSGLS